MIAQNPTTDAERTITGPLHWLWCFLFGWFYYGAKGMWGMAIISFLTANGLLLILPIMNKGLVRKHYENLGWKVRDN